MSIRPYNPQVITYTAAEVDVRYVALDIATDRHQVHFGWAAAGNAFALAVAAPPKNTDGTIPAPANVDANDWVTLADAPANDYRLLLTAHARYLRLTPNGGGPGQVVRIGYQPLPATGT